MNTEPIGFLGSKEWRLEDIDNPDRFPSLHFLPSSNRFTDLHGYVVLNSSHDSETTSIRANALLIGSAKKMAVALQNLRHDAQIRLESFSTDHLACENFYKSVIETATQVLKEAGL